MDNPPPGGMITYAGIGDSIVDVFIHDPNAVIRVIVQFKSSPLSKYMSERGTARKEGYDLAQENINREHNNFRQVLRSLEVRYQDGEDTGRMPAEVSIHQEYQVALNGMAITTRQWVIDEISSLPYFLSVHKDEKVHALLDESVSLIGAGDIWAEYSVTGEGIVVGILDTGIDYMHPDLGGGMGEGFKVKGGFNFVSNTDDPMDDHSHGTHVAGIVAADGVLKGVAPGARLMAYKVLDQQGSGFSSWIIGGIEQSVIDGVHILNASLGGPGNPDDPMSVAIDNASDAGVLCVVAAGNNGPGYSTIDSPGCARNAITVGATDLHDEIAWFSSRGPESKYQAVKPDMVAPGFETLAPVLNGQYARYSGTSMATPHVAGAAALLLQQYPGLNPSQVKSIFSHTAIDIGHDLWTQGLGRIDLVGAFELPEVIVEPPALSFGGVNLLEDVWTATGEISLTNLAAESKTVILDIAGNFPEGAVLTVSPEELILQPQATQEVTLLLEVDNALVPVPGWFPSSFTENIQLVVGENVIDVPVTFLKSNMLTLLFDEAPLWVIVRSDQYFSGFLDYPGLEIIQMVPPGLYDIVVQYQDDNTTLLKEDVEVDSLTILNIAKAEAKNRVVAHNVDEYGKPIIPQKGHEEYYTPQFFVGFLYWAPFYLEKQISDFNKFNWFWVGTYSSDNNAKVYMMGDQLNACSTDVYLAYEPSALHKVSFSYPNLLADRSIFPVTGMNFGGWTMWNWDFYGLPFLYPFTQTFFTSPYYTYNNNRFSFFNEVFDFTEHPFEPSIENIQHISASFSIDDNDHLFGFRNFFNRQHYSTELNSFDLAGDVYRVGLPPPVWGGALWMGNDRIIVDNLVFLYQMKDYKYSDVLPYRLFRNGVLTDSGNFFEDMTPNEWASWHTGRAGELMLEPDEYVLEFDLVSFPIRGHSGTAIARLGFDHSKSYGHIPMLQSLNIISNGHFTDFVGLCQEASIEFRIKMPDDSFDPALVALEYRTENRGDWTALSLENEGVLYWSVIPGSMPGGFISLRVTVEHVSGSFIEYTVEPAFLHAPATLPVVNTFEPEDVFAIAADINGYVAFDGGTPVMQRGMVWGISEHPSLEDHDGLTSDGSGIGSFTSHLTGLEPGVSYFARAYALNEIGVSYGEQVVFQTGEYVPCIPEELPYAFTFEYAGSDDLPGCWAGTGVNNYSVTVSQWSDHQGSIAGAGLFHQSFSHAVISTPAIHTEQDNFRLQFMIRPDLVTLPVSILVGTIDDPGNCNTFNPVKVFELDDLPIERLLTLEAYFEGVAGQETHIAIKVGDYTKNDLGQWILHEVLVEEIPDCPSPSDLQASNLTASSALLAWEQYGDALFWDLVWGIPGFDPDSQGTLVTNIDQTSFLLDNIESSASYEFYVRAYCDLQYSSWSLPCTFNTVCGFFSIPLNEDFDDCIIPHLPLCWHKAGNGHYSVNVLNDQHDENNNFVSLFHHHYAYAMLSTPALGGDVSNLRIKFSAKLFWQIAHATLFVGTIADPLNSSSFTTVKAIELSQQPDQQWQQVVVYFDDHATTDTHIALKLGASTEAPWGEVYIDDIIIEQIPSCPEPYGLYAENITPTSADLVWAQSGEPAHWDILYGMPGFDTDTEGILIDQIQGMSYTLTDQIPGLTYQFYVRTHCAEEVSPWSLPCEFKQACYPEELPYSYNFEQEIPPLLPLCWNATGQNNYIIETSVWWHMSESYTSVRLLHWQASTAILSTPEIIEHTGSFRLQFTVWSEEYHIPESFSVGTMSNPNDPWTYMPVKHFDLQNMPSEPWLTLEFYFYDRVDTNAHVAFKIGNIDQGNVSQLYIQEVHIEEIATCPSPHDLYAGDVSVTSAVLGWSQYGDAEAWDVVWGAPGFDPDLEGTLVEGIDQSHYMLAGLGSATGYVFYVRAHCEEELSAWSLPHYFVTECGLYAIPFWEDFDSWTLPGLHQCWSALGENSYNVDITDHRYYSAFHSARLSAIGNSYAMLVSPQIEVNLNGLLLTFKALRGNCPENVMLYAGSISDPNDVNTFSQIDAFEVTNQHGEHWHSFEVSFADHHTDDNYFAFLINSSTLDFWTRAFIDDISLAISVYNIDVSVFPPGAGIAEGGGEYQHGQQVILTATPHEGYVFDKWTEDGHVVSDNPQYIFAADANRQITANFSLSGPIIPEIRLLQDYIIADGEMHCFDASMYIYLSGEEAAFVVLSGGQVRLIAGNKIVMLPGTHAQQGSYLHAFISPGGPFCDETETHFLAADKLACVDAKDPEIVSVIDTSGTSGLLFRVFPNPAKSQFTVELIEYDGSSAFIAELYNMHGRLVKRKESLQGKMQFIFSLEGQNPGVYLVRVVHGAQTGTERLIRQ